MVLNWILKNLKNGKVGFADAEFILEDGKYICGVK
jgi:hypothetical protein